MLSRKESPPIRQRGEVAVTPISGQVVGGGALHDHGKAALAGPVDAHPEGGHQCVRREGAEDGSTHLIGGGVQFAVDGAVLEDAQGYYRWR